MKVRVTIIRTRRDRSPKRLAHALTLLLDFAGFRTERRDHVSKRGVTIVATNEPLPPILP